MFLTGFNSAWRFRLAIAFALVGAVTLASCGEEQDAAEDLTRSPSVGTLTVGQYAFPQGLGNPFKGSNAPAVFYWSALFDGLTFVGADGTVEPALAIAWRVTGERTWEFDLRPDVTFSNGEAFDAASVARNFDFLMQPEADGWPLTAEAREVESVRALDELTVEFTTKQPMPALPRYLSIMKIVAPGAWESQGPDGFALHPVGTGPFKLEGEWSGQRLEFSAFRDSWRAPKLDRLIMSEIPETSTRVQGLISGDIDIAISLGPDDGPALDAAGGQLAVRKGTSVLTLAFVLNKRSPLQNVQVRRALNYAVDKAAIVETLLVGQTQIASQGLPSHVEGFNPDLEPYPYDPERAKALLASAGFAQGFDMAVDVILGGAANDAAIYQKVANDLRAVGINVEMRSLPVSQFVRNMFQGGWEGEAFGIDYAATAALDPMRPLRYHSCLWVHAWYCNESVMPLIEAATVEMDRAKRLDLIRQIYQIYRDDPPGIYLFETIGFDGVGPRISHFAAPNGVLDYAKIDKVN